MGPPGKAVRLTGRTCSYGWEGQLAVRVGRLGRPQSPTKGVIIRRPRQLQRVARSTWPEGSTVVAASAGDEPAVPRALIVFGGSYGLSMIIQATGKLLVTVLF